MVIYLGKHATGKKVKETVTNNKHILMSNGNLLPFPGSAKVIASPRVGRNKGGFPVGRRAIVMRWRSRLLKAGFSRAALATGMFRFHGVVVLFVLVWWFGGWIQLDKVAAS